ncbi:SET domain-containing protein SmydA-8-like [Microplitis mediator]|uniref:SET domain-containing protein SmydA-8-like n=1 Tax=Microplitis mediator TaxID=375433 RepID=UPI00255604D2|nr:SET domain-containing protein SmydA-8-like [Microplitis mediator]
MKTEVCEVCGKPAEQKCSACKSAFYCSREHQKNHWKEHMKNCKAFKIAEDQNVGRHYIATRKIDAGEVILREMNPLLAAPAQGTSPLCLNCYCLLEKKTARPCDKCGWPLCENCKEHGDECSFTTKYRDAKINIAEFGIPHPTYNCIGIIRALALKEVNPDNYNKLINLEAHDDHKENQRLDEFNGTAKFVKRFFKLDEIDEKEITRIAGIIQINGHEVPTTENSHVAVYDEASYFEHNCKANCSKSFTESGGILIRAALPISKGEHLTMCYTDPLWGVTNRRHHLFQTKLFNCTCSRCSDPTEFGTMFNALKCTKSNCGGYKLPSTFITTTTPMSNEKLPDYICGKCQQATSWEQIEKQLEEIGIELTQMKKNDVEICKNFITKWSKVLHDNHYYLTDVKMALVQLIGQQDGGLPACSDEILSEKISLCKKLDELLRKLVPAEIRIRGLILFEVHAGIAEFGRRQGPDELRGMLMLSRNALAEAYQLLRYEPEILPEGKIAKIAFKNMKEMDIIIKTLCQKTASPM